MMKQNKTWKNIAVICSLMLLAVLWSSNGKLQVYAAAGTIYTCSITPSYSHPVTGIIEDAGGEASYATGQGMVAGAVHTTGMLEVTEEGCYYLTFRLSLMDYTSNHSFQVQNVGDSGWSSPNMGITGNGSDSNGTTADICVQVPSENCIVRGSMYVTPMGRDVIFYLYPGNYTLGNTSGMSATMVTEESAETTTSQETVGNENVTENIESEEKEEVAEQQDTSENAEVSQDSSEENAALSDSITSSDTTASIQQAAASVNTDQNQTQNTETDSQLNSAQGLSLSTEKNIQAEESTAGETAGNQWNIGELIFAITLAVTVSGLILLGTTAFIVYYFRKNWKRWGGWDEE